MWDKRFQDSPGLFLWCAFENVKWDACAKHVCSFYYMNLHRFGSEIQLQLQTWANISQEQIALEYKQLTLKKTCLCTCRRWVYVQIPTQNKAYIISEAALVEKQKLDSHSVCTLSHMGAPTGPFPWKSRITPCFAMCSLFCPHILSWHDCGCQRRNSSLTHCQSEHH